jgi:YD repeat-containing protein
VRERRDGTTNALVDSYTYDANGNMLTGTGRTYEWNAENQPTRITKWPVDERYTYDADGARVKREVIGGSSPGTTYYIGGGLYEEDQPSGTARSIYMHNGGAVAQRTIGGGQDTRVHLFGDHLGSIGYTTYWGGALLSPEP